jgi:hypothetical protein
MTELNVIEIATRDLFTGFRVRYDGLMRSPNFLLNPKIKSKGKKSKIGRKLRECLDYEV